ncbi:cytochrome b [Paraburkholderia sp.]|jgi:cytochrome b561|uniref:cytochrome b n=1 Tax=Paraburkholderia sp. TaxID=1926495 RepID=UPI00262534D0|nr:cytochrome b [Paraburkholderia sp.]
MAPKPNFGTRDSYTRTAIAFHWLIALLIVCGFALGWVMTDIPGFTPAKLRYFSWHKWIGVTVFGLSVLRILWRATHDAPPLPRRISSWQRGAAHFVHLLLYVLIVAIPVSGYLYSSAANVPVVYLGLVPLPRLIAPDPVLKVLLKNIHITLNYTLLVLFVLHVAAALKHQWLDRDGLLSRMIPFLK